VRRPLLIALGAFALGGCRFWYKPVKVANAIGEEKAVLAGDTVNVFTDARFEVYGPSSEAVYDGYEQLNRAYRSFERHFGVVPTRLAFVLQPDTIVSYDPAVRRSFQDRGFVLAQYVRPRSYRNPTRYGALGYGGVIWPIAPTAARILLSRFARNQLDGSGDGVDSALVQRFPLWYRAAVIHLVGEGGLPAADLEFAREKLGHLMPLRDLLTLVRPAGADSVLDPSRRGEADESTRIIAAQASTFARFLVEREGPTVLGRIGRDYLANRPLNEILGKLRNAPTAIPELEQRWRYWLQTRED